jgi:hypothetical protein
MEKLTKHNTKHLNRKPIINGPNGQKYLDALTRHFEKQKSE